MKSIDVLGPQIATASFDNSVGLWSGQTPQWFEGHEAAVNTVKFVGPERVVSGGDDFALRLWDVATGQSSVLGRHQGKVMSLAVSSDQNHVASASWDGRVGIWPLDGRAPRFLTQGTNVNAVVVSDDGGLVYAGGADGSLIAWDVATGRKHRQYLQSGFGINTLALNEAQGWIAYGAVDGVTRVLDLTTGLSIKDFTHDRRPILAMAMDAEGRFLATGDGQGFISIWRIDDWRLLADFRATKRGPIWALGFTGDGQHILAGGLDERVFSWPLDGPRKQLGAATKPWLKGHDQQSNGERQFNRKCSICHSLTDDHQRRAGPTLKDLFGRQAGTLPGYRYSSRLQGSQIIWTADTIDALFDLGPDVYIRGTKMPMQRITERQDRVDLIEFLRGFSNQKGDEK